MAFNIEDWARHQYEAIERGNSPSLVIDLDTFASHEQRDFWNPNLSGEAIDSMNKLAKSGFNVIVGTARRLAYASERVPSEWSIVASDGLEFRIDGAVRTSEKFDLDRCDVAIDAMESQFEGHVRSLGIAVLENEHCASDRVFKVRGTGFVSYEFNQASDRVMRELSEYVRYWQKEFDDVRATFGFRPSMVSERECVEFYTRSSLNNSDRIRASVVGKVLKKIEAKPTVTTCVLTRKDAATTARSVLETGGNVITLLGSKRIISTSQIIPIDSEIPGIGDNLDLPANDRWSIAAEANRVGIYETASPISLSSDLCAALQECKAANLTMRSRARGSRAINNLGRERSLLGDIDALLGD
jgi:hypothetical protein